MFRRAQQTKKEEAPQGRRATLLALDGDFALRLDQGDGEVGGLAELARGLGKDKHSVLLLFDCETASFLATPDAVSAKAGERLRAKSVYCTQLIGDQYHQAFGVPEQLIRDVRAMGFLGVIAPYAVAVRDGLRALLAQRGAEPLAGAQATADIEVPEAGVSHAQIVLDRIGQDVFITVIHGQQILACRRVVASQNLELEILRTTREAKIGEGRIYVTDRSLLSLGGRINFAFEALETGDPLATVAPQGLEACQFRLMEEVAYAQRAAVRRKQLMRLSASVGVAGVTLFLAMAAVGRVALLSSRLDDARAEQARSEARLRQLYFDKYAGLIADSGPGAAELWVELSLTLPPYLDINYVQLDEGSKRAELEQRQDVSSAPMARSDIRNILARYPAWRDARISERFTPHNVMFVIEAPR